MNSIECNTQFGLLPVGTTVLTTTSTVWNKNQQMTPREAQKRFGVTTTDDDDIGWMDLRLRAQAAMKTSLLTLNPAYTYNFY